MSLAWIEFLQISDFTTLIEESMDKCRPARAHDSVRMVSIVRPVLIIMTRFGKSPGRGGSSVDRVPAGDEFGRESLEMTPSDPTLELLLAEARAGDQAALGRLLEHYRNYLRLMARSLIHQPLQVRLDASDLVQETFLKAYREFRQFVGSGERELVAWLRQILVRTLSNQAKHHRAQGRDQRRQESLDVLLDRASVAIQEQLADSVASPSARAVHREQAVLLADALSRLPAEIREVFILRNVEQVSVGDIATRIGRTPNAVRKLWTKAMVALRRALEVQ